MKMVGGGQVRQISYVTTHTRAIFQPPITRLKVTGWSYLSDPVLHSEPLLYSCMQSQAESRNSTVCHSTSVGLQGRRVTLRAHQCSSLPLKLLKTINSRVKGGEAPA